MLKAVSLALVAALFTLAGCQSHDDTAGMTSFAKMPRKNVGKPLERKGDEIMVAGQLFHTGAPVVLWTDPGGCDAYRVERRFAPLEESSWPATTQKVKELDSPNRYSMRRSVLTTQQAEQVRGGGWPLELLQEKVDQFVIHYDVCGVSKRCFEILHDHRGLSVHFMLDIDGTIYQTLDAKERAWHGGTANSRSVGIEIANMGAYASGEAEPFKQWYGKDEKGRTRITIPQRLGDGGVRTPNFVGYPIRAELMLGEVEGRQRRQYDLTREQDESLIKRTATLCKVLPNIECDYPRDEDGKLITKALTEEQQKDYRGLIGHYHVTTQKSDPGPAFQWDYVVDNARKLMGEPRKSAAGTVKTAPPTTQPATAPAELAGR